MKWLVLLMVAGSIARGEPSESVLANRVETQAEVAVGQTNFSPPAMSRFSILVSQAAEGEGGASQLIEAAGGSSGGGAPMQFTGNTAAAVELGSFLATSPLSTLTPLQSIEGAPQIAENATNAVESIQLLNLAMEKTASQGPNAFLTMAAKGAVAAWNQLVNSLMDRMESLYRDPVADTKQWQAIRSFLMDPKTQQYRGVLGSFSQPKPAQ